MMTLEIFVNENLNGSTSMNENELVNPYFARKVWPTRIAGAVLLFLASPVILVLVAIVRMTSNGPGLYRQVRSGRHGKHFEMYKIRTMYADAESVSGPVWCAPGDSRITPLGRILRLLHLDELPQLINVARGDMDLIGPRPERPTIVNSLARDIPGYRARMQVLPGVTGLAQVNLPPDETLDCVRKKLVLDCKYIETANLWLDVRLLLCTLLRMVGIRHGRATRWLGLSRKVVLSEISRASVEIPLKWIHETNHSAAALRAGEKEGRMTLVAVGAEEHNNDSRGSSVGRVEYFKPSAPSSRRPK